MPSHDVGGLPLQIIKKFQALLEQGKCPTCEKKAKIKQMVQVIAEKPSFFALDPTPKAKSARPVSHIECRRCGTFTLQFTGRSKVVPRKYEQPEH